MIKIFYDQNKDLKFAMSFEGHIILLLLIKKKQHFLVYIHQYSVRTEAYFTYGKTVNLK